MSGMSKHSSIILSVVTVAAVLSAAMLLSACSKGKSSGKDGKLTAADTVADPTTVSTTVPDPDPTTVPTTPPASDTDVPDPSKDPDGFEDVGELYFKEPDPEDIVFDPDSGLSYVKNQLLISCFIGTSKDEVEEICKNIDAEIVGYIELTSDFQIEFKEEKTLADLEVIADYINGYPFVQNVTLNLSCPISFDD